MTKRHSFVWIIVILFAGCLVALDAYRRWHDAGPDTREAMLALMPANATAVLFADIAELRGAPFAAAITNWIPSRQKDSDYAEFLHATGFDFERDLDRVAIAAFKTPQDTTLFAVAEGRFDRKKIAAYATQSGTEESQRGREIFTVPLSDTTRKISFTFLRKDEIAITDRQDIGQFLSSEPASADRKEWRERFVRAAGSSVFAVIRQDLAAGNTLASQSPGGFQSPQLSALLDQLQWITLAGKPQDNSLRIVAEGECTSEQTTRQLADLLNGIVVLAQTGLNGPKTRHDLDPGLREAYLELLKSADVSRLDRGETKSVRVLFDVTPKLLDAASGAVPSMPPESAPAVLPGKTPAPKHSKKK